MTAVRVALLQCRKRFKGVQTKNHKCRGFTKRDANVHAFVLMSLLRKFVLFVAFPLVLGLVSDQICARSVWYLLHYFTALATPTRLASTSIPQKKTAVVSIDRLPLRTSGRWIVDRTGKRVQLRCVNWYGAHLKMYSVGGLHLRTVSDLAFAIRDLGFNCVRIPYSLELQFGTAKPSSESLIANPELRNLSGIDVLDAVIAALARAQVLVILNNHQGPAMWCCSEDDGEGLWYSSQYPEQVWVESFAALSQRYRKETFVIGYDLRNELRGTRVEATGEWSLRGLKYKRPTWGIGGNDTDWAGAALRGSLSVLEKNPDALLIIEGLAFATDLTAVRSGSSAARLHLRPELLGHVVYEVHDYCWYHSELLHSWIIYWICCGWVLGLPWHVNWVPWKRPANLLSLDTIMFFSIAIALLFSYWLSSYAYFEAVISANWGFLLDRNEAPVWLGEFGTNGFFVTDNWMFEIGEVMWWRNLIRYIQERQMDYAYWPLNGDNAGAVETFGIFNADYRTLRYPWILEMLP